MNNTIYNGDDSSLNFQGQKYEVFGATMDRFRGLYSITFYVKKNLKTNKMYEITVYSYNRNDKIARSFYESGDFVKGNKYGFVV